MRMLILTNGKKQKLLQKSLIVLNSLVKILVGRTGPDGYRDEPVTPTLSK